MCISTYIHNPINPWSRLNGSLQNISGFRREAPTEASCFRKNEVNVVASLRCRCSAKIMGNIMGKSGGNLSMEVEIWYFVIYLIERVCQIHMKNDDWYMGIYWKSLLEIGGINGKIMGKSWYNDWYMGIDWKSLLEIGDRWFLTYGYPQIILLCLGFSMK